MRFSNRFCLILSCLTVGLSIPPALAQLELIPDTALDRNLGTQVIQNGVGNEVIMGGTRSQNGQNLFHSFQEFNVRENRSVYFQNPTGVQNILTRVTGRDPSDILGTLGVLGNANLFLLNPNGILFGPNAQLQIGGSFFASTANSFKFSDGREFSATNPQAPPLLTVNITPGLQSGSIAAGSTIINRGNLVAGQDLVLEGDRLDLQGQLIAGRDLSLKAQNRLQARDSPIAPLMVRAKGNLWVQGDRAVDIVALSHPQSGFFASGNLVLRSANTVNGDARFQAGGSFRIERLDGTPGNLTSPQDPFIFAAGDVVLGDYIGDSLHIWAGGSVTLGDVEITGVDLANSLVETVTLSDGSTIEINGAAVPTLDVRAGVDWAQLGGLPGNVDSDGLGAAFGTSATSADITIGDIFNFTGTVLITNQYAPNRALSSPNGIRTGSIDVSNADSNGNQFDADAGTVVIDARTNFSLNNDTIFANTFVNGRNSGGVRLLAEGAIAFNTGSVVTNVTNNVVGNGGDITVNSGSLVLANGSSLSSDTLGFGNAGNITVQVRDTVSLFGQDATGVVSSINTNVGNTGSFAEGNGGNISITARSIFLQDNAFFDTSVFNGGTSEDPAIAGDVQITASDTVSFDRSRVFSNVTAGTVGFGGDITITTGSASFTNGSSLISSLQAQDQTFAGAVGEAGNITINAQGLVSFDGVSPNGSISTAESNVGLGAVGDAGKITINAGELSLTNGAELSSGTYGLGNAGDIVVRTQGSVRVDNSLIDSQVGEEVEGLAGKIDIAADSLTLTNGGQILTLTRGLGNAGAINLAVRDRITLDGVSPDGFRSAIASDVESTGEGTSGGITINTGSLFIRNEAELTASTKGFGNAGSIFITARDQVNLTGDGSATPNDIPEGLVPNSINSSADRGSTGNGGSIRIDTPRLFVNQGARILVSNLEEGQAGSIMLNTRSTTLDQGYIQATTSSGNGGDITLNVRDILLLRRGSLISATAGTEQAGGNGGNITIRSAFIVGVLRENSDITANAFTGRGGNINITTNAIFGLRSQPRLTPLSDITASSEFGLNGTIAITTLNVDPNRGLVALPTNLTDPTRQISQTCNPSGSTAARSGRFVVTGRGGIPTSPEAAITGDRPLVDPVLLVPENSNRATSSEASPALVSGSSSNIESTAIIEAQSWARDGDGTIYLMANADSSTIHPAGFRTLPCRD
ncbi:MAG: filamentous hemagglutinin N-terminal domain-containing protein [Leptolyngbyaceae cyanobacterium bins.302]|nr:filamentous hemagglutinin N-terminal domain-containing protein [Leptolyngbyaceae cyanobacterium bins.302]